MNNDKLSVKKLRDAVNRIYNSEEYVKNRKQMDEYERVFEGEIFCEKELSETDSKAQVNYLFSTVVTIAPMLTDNKPIWGIQAKDYFMQRFVTLYQYALEYFWEKEEIDMKIFNCVLSALVMKIGIFKVYFNSDNGTFGDVGVEVINPKTFFIASGYTDPWEAPLCGEKLKKPLSWIKKHFPEHWMHIKPDEDDDKNKDYSSHENVELLDRFCTLYIVWMEDDSIMEYIEEVDKKVKNDSGVEATITEKVKSQKKKYPHGRIVTFANGYDKFLEDKPSPFYHGKAPYVPLYDYKSLFKFMGMGEADQMIGLQKEFNLAFRKVANHVRRWANPNFSGESNNGIDPDLFKSTAPGGGQYYARQPNSKPPEEIQVNPVNRTALEFLYYIPSAIEEQNGVTDVTKGIAQKKQRQSAQEIATLAETSYTRTRQRVRNLEWSIKRLCYLIVSLMQQYYSEIRGINTKKEGEIEYREISNSRNFASAAIKPPEDFVPETPAEEEEYELMEADYKKFVEVFGEVDRIYADFNITIESNSTLPLDKQSLANLYLRLAQIQLTPNSAIDVESLLEGLKIPNKGKIIKRLQQALKQQQPQAGPPQMPAA